MSASVVDTNVLVVANEKAIHAGPECILACVNALVNIQKAGLLVIDSQIQVFREYLNHCSHSGQPGVGDAFFKWAWENQGNHLRCERVDIHSLDGSEEQDREFPEDPELAGFDPSDRKYVAIVLSSQNSPKVLNAVDSDWWDYRDQLERHGVEIEFLCPGQFE